MREIRMLRAMRRVLETKLRKLLTGHEDGNVGYGQGVSYGLPRQHSTQVNRLWDFGEPQVLNNNFCCSRLPRKEDFATTLPVHPLEFH